jgi:hypothetical protein
MTTDVRQEPQNRKPVKIGVDTLSVRLYFTRAHRSLVKSPRLPGFTMGAVYDYSPVFKQGLVWHAWEANHPELKVRVQAHELELWTPPDSDEPIVSGKVDVTFEVSRIRFAQLHPDGLVPGSPNAPFYTNSETCTSSEAGSIVVSLLAEIAESLGLGDYTDEVLTVHVFADVVCPDHKGVLGRFADRSPNVYKASDQPTVIFQPGEGTVEHSRYKGREDGEGRESTKLYARGPKLERDLKDAGFDLFLDPSSRTAQTLRLECVYGKSKKGGCKPLTFRDDFTARPARSGDEDPDETAGGPTGRTLSLESALDPRAWAGILLHRLKECDLYGDNAHTIEVALTPSDLRVRLIAAGVCRGTAHQYASIVFEGKETLKKEGCDVNKIIRKVESIVGATFLREEDRQPQDVFGDIIRECIVLARAGDRPDISTWERIPILPEGTTPPLGPVQADAAPVDIPPMILDFDLGRSPIDVASPAEHGIGIVEGQATQTNKALSEPLSARADTANVLPGCANRSNDSTSIIYAPETDGADTAPAAMSTPTKSNARKRRPEPAPDPEAARIDGLLALVCDDPGGELKETTT